MLEWVLHNVRNLRRGKGVKYIIDGENLRISLRRLNEELNEGGDILGVINNLKKYLDKGEGIKEIYFFDTLWSDNNRDQMALRKRLKKNNVKVVLKRGKVIISGMTKKSRADSWINVEIMKTITQTSIRKVLLFSGDSDFEAPLREVKRWGIKSVVISSHHDISRELKAVSDQVIYLEELLSHTINVSL